MADELKMTVRSVRVADDVWNEIKDQAAEADLSISEYVRTRLVDPPETSDDEVEFRDVSAEERERLAKEKKALPDGSFPVDNCEDLKNAIQAIGRAKDRDKAIAHIKKRANALDCPDVELPDSFEIDEHGEECESCEAMESATAEAVVAEPRSDSLVAAIFGTGRLSESEDPETQAAITRVKELLSEGAVGVSIAHDQNPDDMPEPSVLESLMSEGKEDEIQSLLDGVSYRVRHVAIVDTPAFSDARLTLNEDGTVSGPIVFEGKWTGDGRFIDHGKLVWNDDNLHIPIIWDRLDGDHTGMTVGYIETLERQDGVDTAVRPAPVSEEEIEAVTAAAGVSVLPAAMFAKFTPTKAQPLRISTPDKNGFRRIWGHAVPRGVCHRSDMGACFQYPGDVDKNLSGFHTGAEVTLDDGSALRVGALTFGGLHIDTRLAKQGVGVREVNRHREDSNKVLAMVRGWEDQFGLAVSGIVPSSVTDDELLQALACAPSVEMWPSGRGRTLVGVHIVPTPAWPVAASVGDSTEFAGPAPIEIEDASELEGHGFDGEFIGYDFDGLDTRLDRIEKALALLVADKMTDVPLPE